MVHTVRDGAFRILTGCLAVLLAIALAPAAGTPAADAPLLSDRLIADIRFDEPVAGSFYGVRLKLPKPHDITVEPGEGAVMLSFGGKTVVVCFLMPPEDLLPDSDLFALQKGDLAKEIAGGEYGDLVLGVVAAEVPMRVEGVPAIVQNTDRTVFAATELVADNPPPDAEEPLPHLDVLHGFFIANGVSFQFLAVTSRDGYREPGEALFTSWLNELVRINDE